MLCPLLLAVLPAKVDRRTVRVHRGALKMPPPSAPVFPESVLSLHRERTGVVNAAAAALATLS